jgi:DNA-binding transcriptional regulator YiaG
MKIKIEDITPDLILELQQEAEEAQLKNLTRKALSDLVDKREKLADELEKVELQCKIRAMRAHGLGFSKKELSEIFNVTTRAITKWIGK